MRNLISENCSHHDIAEILLKLVLHTNQSIIMSQRPCYNVVYVQNNYYPYISFIAIFFSWEQNICFYKKRWYVYYLFVQGKKIYWQSRSLYYNSVTWNNRTTYKTVKRPTLPDKKYPVESEHGIWNIMHKPQI